MSDLKGSQLFPPVKMIKDPGAQAWARKFTALTNEAFRKISLAQKQKVEAHNILSADHSDTATAAVVRGDILVGNSTPKWSRLGAGASGRFLRSDGTDASWSTIGAADLPTGIDAAKISGGDVSNTEFDYLNGVTSAIQTQIDGKQPLDSDLTAIAALSNADGNFIVGNGSAWVAESGDTARASLGVGPNDSPTFTALTLTGSPDALTVDDGIIVTPYAVVTDQLYVGEAGAIAQIPASEDRIDLFVADIYQTKNQNASTIFRVQNTTAGTAATAEIHAIGQSATGKFLALSDSYTSSRIFTSGAVVLTETGADVMNIGTASNVDLVFWTNNLDRMHIENTGQTVVHGRLKVGDDSLPAADVDVQESGLFGSPVSIGSGGVGALGVSILTAIKSSTSSTLTNAANLGFTNQYTGNKTNLRGALISAVHRPATGDAVVTNGYGISANLEVGTDDESENSPKITTGIAGDFGITISDGEEATGNPEVTTGYIIRARAAVKSALGVLTTVYAVYDAGQTAATTNWGFYGLSANNYLSGRLVFEDLTNKDVYISSEAAGYLDLAAPTGIRLNQNTDITGEARCNSFRIDQVAAVDAQTDGTHTITISANGTNYKLLAVAA